ncbi:MAG: hypothetical protein N3C60_04030 [Calditerrivibrio sp.]|nr:hypothetical protein [Calditerrivibrio sp.]
MKNISFETKTFVLILFILMLGLSMINFIFIQSIKIQTEELLRQEIIYYKRLSKNNIPFEYPDYLKISKNEVSVRNFILFEVDKPNYFYVKKDFFVERIRNKVYLMIYWDFFILLAISLLYYFTVHKMLLKQKRLANSFETILMIFSHKLRNFLSIQKINIELIKSSNLNAAKRIEESCKSLGTDLEGMEKYIKKINLYSENVQEVDLKTFISGFIKTFFTKELVIKDRLKDLKIEVNIYDLEFLVFLLFDNISKYSGKFFLVKNGVFRGKKYLILVNDYGENNSSGLGVGLSVAEMLCKKNNFKIKWRKKESVFVVVIFLGK